LDKTSLLEVCERRKMTRAQKSELIDTLTNGFKEANAIAVCDYKGLTVKSLESLRKEIREVGGHVQVVKNTLANLALNGAEKSGIELNGTNIFIWSEDQISLSKVIVKFAKDEEAFAIKQGHYEGEAVDAAHIEAISKMPSRDELIGMLLSVWTAPVRNFVTGLDNLAKKKESEAA
jgi:large subunit ribosomal protein L10